MKEPRTSSEALNICKTQGYFHEAYCQSLHANARNSKNIEVTFSAKTLTYILNGKLLLKSFISKKRKRAAINGQYYGFMLLQIISSVVKCLEREGTQYKVKNVRWRWKENQCYRKQQALVSSCSYRLKRRVTKMKSGKKTLSKKEKKKKMEEYP